MDTDDNTLFTMLFDGSPAKGAEALMEGFKRSKSAEWATLGALQHAQIEAAVKDQVASGFDISLGSILAAGWSDVAKVREAINAPAGDSRTVSLLSHEFEWSTKPTLVITIEGVSPYTIEFDLVLSLDIEAAKLTISDGRIHKAELGEFRSEAKLLFRGAQISHWPLKSGRLPGEITCVGIQQRRSGYDELSFGRRPGDV
jgi:hypothetical protein